MFFVNLNRSSGIFSRPVVLKAGLFFAILVRRTREKAPKKAQDTRGLLNCKAHEGEEHRLWWCT